MNCASCGRSNRSEARFCDHCGAALGAEPARSPRAYTPKHLADRILTSRSALEGERKQVTVLFADIAGSTELSNRLGLEAWHKLLDAWFRILADGVHRYEGTINQFTGDGVMALFGAPVAHEDHGIRACHAALELARELERFSQAQHARVGFGVPARIGLNSGEVVVGRIGDDLRMDYTAQGHTVALAARLQEIAAPGKPCISEQVARLVDGYFGLRDLGLTTLKGFGEPVRVYALDSLGVLRTRLDRARLAGFSKLVGRESELGLLESLLARALARDGQAVAVVGEAGQGKSRVAFEFVAHCRAEGVAVYEAHSPSHGATLPLFAIAELLRSYFGIAASDAPGTSREKVATRLLALSPAFKSSLPAVFDALSIGDTASRQTLSSSDDARRPSLGRFLRHWVQAASASAPMVLLLDDLHWIDPESHALLAELVEGLAWTRTLFVANHRPEYGADWLRGSHCRALPLGPLEPDERRALLRALLGEDASVLAFAEQIDARAGGNPFFLEEIVRAAANAGRLEGEHGAYRLARAEAELEIPHTVQGVLAGRIDRLPEREKQLLQTAAAIGTSFDLRLLERVGAFTSEAAAAGVAALVALQLLEQSASGYAFRHPLTQEVAYQSQLESRRAELHRATARALEEIFADRLGEHASLIAHHWQAAGARYEASRWRHRAALRVSSIQLPRRREAPH
ncbi:MAG: adenylate/guanylate cyclase domain-containing protein [Myxococcota bacterium]